MANHDWQIMHFGLREAIIIVIALVALYMLRVVWRMFRLRQRGQVAAIPAVADVPPPVVAAPMPTEAALDDRVTETVAVAPDGLAEQVLRLGLEREIAQLRDEVDALRGEVAALRDDMQQELHHLRASQTVSPIYGDAMQLAASGYDAAAIAERCGIARAEADLVVALTKSQDR